MTDGNEELYGYGATSGRDDQRLKVTQVGRFAGDGRLPEVIPSVDQPQQQRQQRPQGRPQQGQQPQGRPQQGQQLQGRQQRPPQGQQPQGQQQRPPQGQQPRRQDPRGQADPRQADPYQPNPHQANPYQSAPQQAPAGFVSAADKAMARTSKASQNAYNQFAHANGAYVAEQRTGMSRGKKIGIAIAILVVIGALVAAGFYIYTEMRKSQINADLHSMQKEELEAIDAELTGNTNFDQPFTMLLLGSDERTDDPAMGARTDTIILVRVDPNTKNVSMVSIPRDTMVDLPGVGQAKINAAYYFGGTASTIAAVKNLTGVDIDHYASINFDGLVQLVDSMGGIDVFVDERIDDWKAGDAIVEAGQQHLNGAQALVLARSRDYADGDYTRQVNQRKVIMGIVERAMNAKATELAGLIQASTKFLQTDSSIDFDWIFSLADQIRHTDTEHPLAVNSTTLPSRAAYIGEVSYVIADKAGTAELMQRFLAGGDVSQPLTQSSIDADVAAAGGGSGPTGGNDNANNGEEYYYEEPVYYEEVYYEGGE